MQYPALCNTNEKKLAFAFRVIEKLRLEHNLKAKELELSKFREYQDGSFKEKEDLAVREILKFKKLLKESTEWDKDIILDKLEG